MLRHDDGSMLTGPPAAPGPETALVARLEQLSAHLDTDPDPQYRARVRARLVAMAAVRTPEPAPRTLRDRLLAARAVDRPPSRWRARTTAALAGTAVGVTGLAALVAVAAGAEPGDALYGLKRGTEETQVALAGDSRGHTLLELAGTRLQELGLIAGEGDVPLVVRTLATMDQHTTEGAAWLTWRAARTQDTGPLEALAGWTAEQSAGLTALETAVPAGAELAFGRSADLLGALTVRAEDLHAALGCATGPATAGDDALGPVPGRCPADTPAEVVQAPGTPARPRTGTDAVTDAGTGVPPSAEPAAPASPAGPAPSSAPAGPPPSTPPGTARVPGPGPVPIEVPDLRPDGDVLPPLPTLPSPGVAGAGATRTPPPPVVAVPLPGPSRVCLPPVAATGDC